MIWHAAHEGVVVSKKLAMSPFHPALQRVALTPSTTRARTRAHTRARIHVFLPRYAKPWFVELNNVGLGKASYKELPNLENLEGNREERAEQRRKKVGTDAKKAGTDVRKVGTDAK